MSKRIKKRVTIFTVNMSNGNTIKNDLQTLAEYGRNAFKGVGCFDGPLVFVKYGKKNNFIIDNGAIIQKDLSPLIYIEMKNGTASESSLGAMQLEEQIFLRLRQDWGIWLDNNDTISGLIDLYFMSTLLYIDKSLNNK